MDMWAIRQLMIDKGVYSDPAFQNTNAIIRPIPCFNSCPLGLYFPTDEYVERFEQVIPGNTIIVPPNVQAGTILHELGHRYGDYYYSDCSEEFAEDFRRRYQRGMALLYEGADFHRLASFDKLFREGERGAVVMDFGRSLSPTELYQIQESLAAHADGEAAPRVSQVYQYGQPLVRVDFTQGVAWVPIIAAVFIFAVGAALFYGVYKMFAAVPWIVPTALLGLGIFVGLRALARATKT